MIWNKKILVLVSCWVFISCYSYSNDQSKKPNIIYILADDLGYGDLGCYGQKVIRTPNIDQLAKEGIRFTNHYAGNTVCAPSRASLLTGFHTGHTYLRSNGDIQLRRDPEDITIAKYLKDAGYNTAMIGKSSTGCKCDSLQPNDKGFNHFFGYLGHGSAHTYFPKTLYRNGKPIHYPHNGNDNKWRGETYSHDLFIEDALNYIEDKKDEPFFLLYAASLPHAQMYIPEEYMQDYLGKFKEVPYEGRHYGRSETPNATTAAMISRLDWEVGQIMEQLDTLGLAENTIVMFSSDNGPHEEGGRDPKFFNSSSPFRGIKRDFYDGGIRVPFIVKWSNVIQSNSTSNHLSAFWDVLPTLCDILGAKYPQNIDGISFLPTLEGKRKQQQHDYLYWELREGKGKKAILKEDWKLIEITNIKKNEKSYELYNLRNDVGERTNLSEINIEKREELYQLMQNARTESHFEHDNY